MSKFVAFLRGVNIGGKSLVKMSELVESMSKAGLSDVQAYIQSGNVIFYSIESNTNQLAQQFNLIVEVAVFTKNERKC